MVGKRFAWLAAAALVVGVVGFASCGGETEAATECEPGTDVFCKCQAGLGDGTKRCKDDGKTYEECITPDGPCSELEPTTTGSGSGGGSTQTDCRPGQHFPCTCENGDEGTQTCNDEGDALGPCSTDDGPCGSGQSTTGAGGGSQGEALFYPCLQASECESNTCEMGFCTRECGNGADCEDGIVGGTCARFDGGSLQVCAPFCTELSECEGAYGEPSTCGYGVDPSDPGYYFTVCGDWLDELSPLPPGYPCESDIDCSLGIPGAERVCDLEECIEGCFVDEDCPGSDLCDSDGSFPGSCF